jgi:hypothetical protein
VSKAALSERKLVNTTSSDKNSFNWTCSRLQISSFFALLGSKTWSSILKPILQKSLEIVTSFFLFFERMMKQPDA